MHSDFIFELGCEELPSASVWPLARDFAKDILASLDKMQLQYGEVKRFASPRRIALVIFNLQTESECKGSLRRGPSIASAYDKAGQPSQALLGFAASCKVDLSQLISIQTDKGEWIAYETPASSIKTKELLPGFVNHALQSLELKKPMRWGDSEVEFARPVHWAVMLFGKGVIKADVLGLQSSNQSRGHRFHCPQAFTITSALQYENQLKEAYVLADFEKRRQVIKEQVEELAKREEAVAVMPSELIDEVTSIVEWPQSLLCRFDEIFLKLPIEVLIAAMQVHQKCFALKDKTGQLLPYFITTTNIESSNPKQVILGNEKVMRARLSDAAFFFKQDKHQALIDYLDTSKQVVFQVKLGSLYAKILRINALMSYFSQALSLPREQCERAALLSKCDLMTGMVGEFPILQGLMGYYYATHDGEEREVAKALNEHYMPRFALDDLPTQDLSKALSLADRIDTLVGIFGIGQKPSGLKDPFKLRRHALAVARLLISIPEPLNVSTLIDQAWSHYGDSLKDKSQVAELKSFILERLQSYYQSNGFALELILAARACQDEWLFDLDKRLKALNYFVNEHRVEASSLSLAVKRVNNLLMHAGELAFHCDIDESLLEETAEKMLYEKLNQMSHLADTLYAEGNYKDLLLHLASLKEPVDVFFEKVMVMVENDALKMNRLAVLSKLKTLLQGVADISLLQMP